MSYDPLIHQRRSIRLENYDYSWPGFYFITICTYQGQHLFGKINKDGMELNQYGQIAQQEMFRTCQLCQVELDELIIMPNHLHAIVILPLKKNQNSLAKIVAAYKGAVTRTIRALKNNHNLPIWHRNYYEHIIRNNRDYQQIRQYIIDNPRRWWERQKENLIDSGYE